MVQIEFPTEIFMQENCRKYCTQTQWKRKNTLVQYCHGCTIFNTALATFGYEVYKIRGTRKDWQRRFSVAKTSSCTQSLDECRSFSWLKTNFSLKKKIAICLIQFYLSNSTFALKSHYSNILSSHEFPRVLWKNMWNHRNLNQGIAEF